MNRQKNAVTMKHYAVSKRKEILTLAAVWMTLKDSIQNMHQFGLEKVLKVKDGNDYTVKQRYFKYWNRNLL
jgi:hypothetical protein